jgi:hypothetical protein
MIRFVPLGSYGAQHVHAVVTAIRKSPEPPPIVTFSVEKSNPETGRLPGNTGRLNQPVVAQYCNAGVPVATALGFLPKIAANQGQRSDPVGATTTIFSPL